MPCGSWLEHVILRHGEPQVRSELHGRRAKQHHRGLCGVDVEASRRPLDGNDLERRARQIHQEPSTSTASTLPSAPVTPARLSPRNGGKAGVANGGKTPPGIETVSADGRGASVIPT